MNDSKTAVRFLAYAMGLYVLWYIFYDLWLLNDGRLDWWLSENVAHFSGNVLAALGFNAGSDRYIVMLNGYKSVIVGPPCNGLVLYALFTGFIIAFPGPWKKKLWYIPLGIATIYFLNILRVVGLSLNSYYSQDTFHFNHKYTYVFIVYAFIFGLWMLWAKKFSPKPEAVLTNDAPDATLAR